MATNLQQWKGSKKFIEQAPEFKSAFGVLRSLSGA